MTPKVALQTYTIRRFTKSPQAIGSALERVKALGINAIEFAYIKLRDQEIKAVAQACKRLGIDVVSSQITFDFLDKNRDWILNTHLKQLKCELVTVSVLPNWVVKGSERDMLEFAQKLNELGKYYTERGLTFGFHHHDYELRRYGKSTGLELLLEHTDPQFVGLIVDCYWAQRGGHTPQHLIEAKSGRVKGIHLRDYGVRRGLLEMQTVDFALGEGNLNIEAIIQSAKNTNVAYLAIEQSSSQPFEQLRLSVDHLRALGHNNLF